MGGAGKASREFYHLHPTHQASTHRASSMISPCRLLTLLTLLPLFSSAAPLRTTTTDNNLLQLGDKPYTVPYEKSFRRQLREHPSSKVCLYRSYENHAPHVITPGCVSTVNIDEKDIESKRNDWSLFSSNKVRIESWKCGSNTIHTPNTWFHINDLTLDDADDWVWSMDDKDKDLYDNAVSCHAKLDIGQHAASSAEVADDEEDHEVEENHEEHHEEHHHEDVPERLSSHGSFDDDHDNVADDTPPPPPPPSSSSSSFSCSETITFKQVCEQAQTMSSMTKEFWSEEETMHDVCGAIVNDRKSADYLCCTKHYDAIVDIVTSPCRDRDDIEWRSPSTRTWTTMCAQDDYARLVGVDAKNKPWSHPHYPPWLPKTFTKKKNTGAPYTFAWEKESSDIGILNYYRPEFLGEGRIGDKAWLEMCAEGHEPCLPPYCPKEGIVKQCVESGYLHSAHRSTRNLKVWKGEDTRHQDWFDAEPRLTKRVPAKEGSATKFVLTSVEETNNKMMLVHYCTMKRDAQEALRCLDQMTNPQVKVLSKKEKNLLSVRFYNALVIKNVRICAESEPKSGDKHMLGQRTETSTGSESSGSIRGHPCLRTKGAEGRPDAACDVRVSENFLICFHTMMVNKHTDPHDKAKKLLSFVDNYDIRTKDTEEKKKTDEWYEESQILFWKENSRRSKNRIEWKKDEKIAQSSMWMTVANLRRIKQGLDRFRKEKPLEGAVMDILCWEDYVKISPCNDDKNDATEEEERSSGCVPANNYVEYFPTGNGLIQEIASYTWEIAHAKCEPTLGLAYAQVLEVTAMFPLAKSNLHFHLVAERPPSKHSDCYVLEQMKSCAQDYQSPPCLCPQARDYHGFKDLDVGGGAILNPDWIDSKKKLSSIEHKRGTFYYEANKAIGVFATVMNDWAAMSTNR